MTSINKCKQNGKRQSNKRIAVKSIIYRVIGFLIMLTVSYFLTQDVKLTFGISLLTESLQLLAYYCYEHKWNGIKWGLI
tara:strand:+ start:637 stop:873 length:237 start_codon:yes stop_codon:yes gene_type:complete